VARYQQATRVMQETTKWLLTAAAALGGVLLAGLQFSDLGQLQLGEAAFTTALIGTGIALLGVGVILWRASHLLTFHIDSFREVLAAGEHAERRHGVRAEMVDKLINAVEGEATFLYQGAARDRRELFADLRAATNQLYQLRCTDTPLSPSQDELVIRARVDELTAAATRVVEYADYWLTRQDFRRLLWWLFGAGTLIAIGTVLFSTAITQHDQATAVTKPMAVEVFLTEKGRKVIGEQLDCSIAVLAGQAVAGDLREPEVVVGASAPCRAGRFHVTSDLGVAVPR
jgi:hypothetical protein